MIGEKGRSAVLLLAHGTPDVLGEMAEYLSKVTGGRALPQEVVEELQHRYGLIGLNERARLLGGTLDLHTAPGKGTRIEFHWSKHRD